MRLKDKKVNVFLYWQEGDNYLFLLFKRINSEDFWQPITGGVEDFDQSLKKAAIRELKEEAGISKKNIKKEINDFYQFQFELDWITITEHCFAFEVDLDFPIDINNNVYQEHSEYKWCDYEEAKGLLKYNHDVLEELVKVLNK